MTIAMNNRFSSPLLCLLSAAVAIFPLAAGTPSPAQSRPIPNPQLASPELNKRVESLLKQMTLDEKIGQLVQYSAGFATGPNGSKLSYEELTRQGKIGSFLNLTDPEKSNPLQKIAVEQSRLHIPLIFGNDVIHGERTIFPVPIALSTSWDPALIASVARTAAVESRADGIQWVFSPMVDIARDARWGRIVESAGEDPWLGSAIAQAWVRGYQQGDLSKPDSVAVSVKHYAAYGAAIAGRDYNATDMSDNQLRQTWLPPYHAAVDAGAATIMSSFNSINGVPATANHYTLTDILRKEWGFDGLVVSDWGAVAELLNHSIAPNGATAARKALTAGVDMDMEGDLYRTTLAEQVRSGVIPESIVDEATRRVLRVKFALGLFQHPYAAPRPAYVATAEKRAQARQVAAETIVLLKNDGTEGHGPLLPLGKLAKTVALIAPFADSAQDMLGSWAAAGNPADAVTLRTALSERLGANLLVSRGVDILPGHDADVLSHTSFLDGPAAQPAPPAIADEPQSIAAAVATAQKSDIVIAALGEQGDWMTGEASSRAHLDLPGHQQQLLEALAATGKPIVLVLFTGRPSAIPWAAAHIPAIVQAWFPGIEAGHALADILFGDTNPSAKLTTSFPYSVGQEPLYYAQLPTGRPAHGDLSHLPVDAGEKFQSRYLDEENKALFPFGWGLSYTRFRYTPPTVTRTQIWANQLKPGNPALTIRATVTNNGSVPGTEIVQLYLRNTSASVEQPVRELKGFQRVSLAPGESKTVEFPIGFEELSFINADSHRVVEPTTYKAWIGGNSLADQETTFEVK